VHLKQSTAAVVSFGPFVDKTDGVTPETGLVSAIDHATTGILLSKNGGALTIRSQAVTASTYDAYGNYRVTLSTTDTNTLGTLRMQFIETATCLPVWQDFMVLPANVWDSLYGADLLKVDCTSWLDQTIAAVDTNGYPKVTVKDGTGQGEIATTSGKVDGVVLTDTLTTYTGNTLQTANVATLITTVGAAGAGLTAVPWNAAWDAEVQSEVQDALEANNLDHLLKVAAVAGDAVDESIIARLASKSATPSFASFVNTTDSLEAIRDNMPTVTGGGVTLADGVTHGGTTAKMRLGSSNATPALHVTNSDGDAVVFDATAGTGNAFTCHAIYGQGLYLYSETTYGMWCRGWNFGMLLQSNNSNALYIDSDNGAGIFIEAAGHGIDMAITGTNKHGINVTAGTAGVCDAVKLNAGTGGVGLRADSLTVTGATTLTGAVTATNASNNVRLGTFTVDINAIAWNAAWDTEVQSECADAITAASLATAANVSAVMTTAMTESYNADGVAPTPAQALFGCLQRLTEFAITGATISVKKLDGTTEAFTLTMDSATVPTSSTRAT